MGACRAEPPAGSPAVPDPSVADSPAAETSAADPSRERKPEESTDAPAPGTMETPGSRSGRLSRRDFPSPARLGAGWDYVVDKGDAEEGYVGNGTPALARNPDEIVQTAVPFGCARRSPMPRPDHALEVDYTASGTRVIAIRSQFTDAVTARTFFLHRRANLDACRGRGGGAVGPLVTDVRRYGDSVLLNGRTQQSDPWMELAVLDGDSVVLVAAQNRANAPPLDAGTARRLARTFRTR